jgi:ABC-2 type transport system permease protein
MTLYIHELKRGKPALIIWTAVLSFMLGLCILIYPEMAAQIDEVSAIFSDMGSFSAAFGMDQLSFGEFGGYFGIECGNTLGIGGGLFAALLGISALAQEEGERTAEFLLCHPVSRMYVFRQKLAAVVTRILIHNLLVAVLSLGAMAVIGESLGAKTLLLLFGSYTLMELEIACLTFALSAYLRKNSLAIGLALAMGLYFGNLLSNLVEELKFLKYLTPYAYTDPAYILNEGSLPWKYLLTGAVLSIIALTPAAIHYRRKDIL